MSHSFALDHISTVEMVAGVNGGCHSPGPSTIQTTSRGVQRQAMYGSIRCQIISCDSAAAAETSRSCRRSARLAGADSVLFNYRRH